MRRKQHVAGPNSTTSSRNITDKGRRVVRRPAVAELLERRAYLTAQISFGNSIIDNATSDTVQAVDFTIGHFNSGPKVDLGVHYHWPGHTDVYAVELGNGNGTFDLAGQVSDFYPSEGKLATGDLDGDGKTDLFTSVGNLNLFEFPDSDHSGHTRVEEWQGDGNGNLIANSPGEKAYTALLTRALNSISNFTTADMTGDGKTDLITVGTEGLVIWQSGANGDARRFFRQSLDPSPTYLTVNAIDVNGDGRRDIITTNQTGGGPMITVWVNNGNGSYSAKTSSALSATPTKLRMADFNHDGKLDAAVLERTNVGSFVNICIGNGDGTFKAPGTYKLNVDAADFTIADIDIDGRPDVAFTMPTVPGLGLSRAFGVLHNLGDGTMERVNSPYGDLGTDLIDSADFNGDGKADLIVRYADSKQLAIILNTAVPLNVIRGKVFNDLNQDQVQDNNEPGIAGRRVFVDVNNDGVFDANNYTTTIGDGSWELRVPNGTYNIRQELTPRWLQTAPYAFSGIPEAHVVTVSGVVLNSGNDFGTYDQGNITGVVYADTNANKIRDPFESGYATQSVYLDLNNNGTQDFMEPYAVTDASGRYKFDVGNGTYTVRTTINAGWQATGVTSYVAKVTSTASFNGGLDFGQTLPATISGHVYYDYSVNSRRDAEDFGVGGIQVFIDTNKNGIPDAGELTTTTSTSANPALVGGYSFTGLYPNTYTVRAIMPPTYQQVTPAGGGPFVTFAYGGADTTYTDIGVIRPIRVSGTAYRDGNANGVIDAGEPALPDVPVFIDYDGDGLPDLEEPYARTNANGNYTLVSTREGTFNVRVLRRSGLSSTVPGSSLYAVAFTYGAATTTGKNFGLIDGPFATAPYESPININTSTNPTALAAGDFNGDGKQDFIVASNSSSSRVYLGQGNGLFKAGQELSIGDSTRYMIAVDISGDGKPDLIAANEALDFGASVLIGNGNGTFKDAVGYAVTTNTYGVAAADFNGDGSRDLAYVGTTDGRVAILINKGTGLFKKATFVNNTFGGKSIATGDVNRDGNADLVVANPSSDAVSVLLGDGKGGFTKIATDVTGGIVQPNFVTLADFNKDGKLDLVAINEFSDEVRVKLGNGKGAFGTGRTYGTGSMPTQVAVLDVDGDGKLDLIVSCKSDGTTDISGGVSILRGRGDGTFVDQETRTAHTSPTAVAIADYDGDGKLDIVAANFFSDDVSLLINGSPGALGSIKGKIWNDANGNGVVDAGETGVGGQTVFTDVNNNGVYDLGERFARTAPDGSYALVDLPAGKYRIRAVIPDELAQTSPANRAALAVKLAVGQAVTGENIGETPTFVVGSYVFDDLGAQLTGKWAHASATGQYAGGFLNDANAGQGTKSVRFDLNLPTSGYYQVAARWVAGADRASNVPIDIQTATNTRTVKINERKTGAKWFNLGVYNFDTTGGSITFRTTAANGLVVADAVRLVPVAAPSIVSKDNADLSGVTITGGWTSATTPANFFGSDYLQDGNPFTKGGRSVLFTPTLASSGVYEIFSRWTDGNDRASNARYDITGAGGTASVFVDQRTQGGLWVSLGFFNLNPATAKVTIRNDNANGTVVADAVRFVRVS